MAIPFQLMVGDTMLSMFGTTTVFGTPVDITLSELTLETFFPADAATAEILRAAHEARRPLPRAPRRPAGASPPPTPA